MEGIGYSRLRSNNSIYIYSKGDIKVIVFFFFFFFQWQHVLAGPLHGNVVLQNIWFP
jgi:hypothetical protein